MRSNQKRETKNSANIPTENEVKNIFERAKMNLIRKENQRKEIRYATVNSMLNNMMKKKLKINDEYSFHSKLIDEGKSSIENFTVITTQLNSILSKFSGKKHNNIKNKGNKLNQSLLSTLSSSL